MAKTNTFMKHTGLFFRAFLVVSLLLSSQVYAFGGLRSKRMFKPESVRGVDAFGFYFGGDGQADIKFTPCDDPNASRDIHGVCNCNPGYKSETVKTDENIEVEQCVVDACYGKNLHNGCITCTSENSIATIEHQTTCKDGKWICKSDNCINPCDDEEYDHEWTRKSEDYQFAC